MYITADQPTTSRALAALRQFDTAIKSHRLHGRYALSCALKADAVVAIDRAVAFCDELTADIGADTQLGSAGTPAGWRRHFENKRYWLHSAS